jgi:hypothetical protein
MRTHSVLRHWLAAPIFFYAVGAFAAAQENPAAQLQAMQKMLQQDVQPIQTATQMLNHCGTIVHNLGQQKAPPGHADAKALEHHNQNIFKKAPTHINEVAKKHEPQHENFMPLMQKGKADLEQCAQQLAPWMKPMPKHLQKLHDMIDTVGKPGGMTQDMAKNLHTVIVNYDNTHDKFVEAVGQLSKDQHVQSYLHESILKLIEATTAPNDFTKK